MTSAISPIKNGYTFAGWYSDEACTKEFDFAKPLLEDVTIYTKWKKVIDPMEKEDQTTSINSVKTGDNFAIQGYVLGLIGVMAAIVMMQKKYNK
ncbi:MAG: InlB B-repeat-containing protein [Faecalibacillus sp.]